jgi:uncharacterized glyoxalase superfamily protein PhnB
MTQTVYPVPRYRDARVAIDFLQRCFGFEPLSVTEGEGDNIVHAELNVGAGLIMLSSTSDADPFPAGPSTFYVAVQDPDAHHDRANGAGAEIVMELTDQPYGSREYAARDPEGNVWTFGTYRPQAPGG